MEDKVLIITYYYPPAGGSGVQRWFYFSQYLKNFGIKPYVITVDEKYASYPKIDRKFEVDKNVSVYRTKTKELLKLYSWIFKGNSRAGIPQGEITKKNILKKIAAFLRGNFFIPDARVGWVPFAFKKALEVIEKENIKKVITTGPPHSTHLVGLKLKKSKEITWIVDFRDPWTDIFYLKEMNRFSFAQKKDKNLEREVLKKSDIILTTLTENFHALLQKKVNKKLTIYTLYNGFDAEILKKGVIQKSNEFRIVFTGLLTQNHPFKSFINALKKNINTHTKIPIKFYFAGSCSDSILKYLKEQLKEAFVFYGYLPHAKSVSLIKNAELLVNFLFQSEEPSLMISGKLMEYIATENPIISIGDENSEAKKLLEQGDNAKMIAPEKSKQMVAFIEKNIKDWQQGNLVKNKMPNLHQYSRENVTKQLTHILQKSI